MGICALRAERAADLERSGGSFVIGTGQEKAVSLFLRLFLMSEQGVYHVLNAFPTCGVKRVDCGGSRGGVCEQFRLQDIRKQQIG